jgi:subtilisin family serine protease
MKRNFFSFAGKTTLTAGALSLLLLTSCEKASEDMAPTSDDSPTSLRTMSTAPGQLYEPNQVLVKFREGTLEQSKSRTLKMITGDITEKILTASMKRAGDNEGLLVIKTPMAVLEAVARLKGQAGIEYVEPNYIYQHQAATAEPYFTNGSLWGMYGDGTSPANQYGSQAAEAWAAGHTGSASVVVGIIDEGIQFTHPDLEGQVWTNPYDPVDGIDNDGNGYKDDVHGWDFDGNNNSIYDGGTTGSLDDHGTHVAGTIGAKSNGLGVVGVNWNVTIISCKFLGRQGGNTANAVKACDYLTDLKTRHGMNIVASNNSWGGGGYSQAMYDAINRANTQNIVFVAAAGNGGTDGIGDNNDAVASYPSNYTNANVIAVASITSTGGISSFSNYGATSVDIGAPGSGIWSSTAYNMLSNFNGTSMATPHVTGGVALYASTHPGSSAATIKSAVLSSAVPTASLSGKCTTGGRLNISGF